MILNAGLTLCGGAPAVVWYLDHLGIMRLIRAEIPPLAEQVYEIDLPGVDAAPQPALAGVEFAGGHPMVVWSITEGNFFRCRRLEAPILGDHAQVDLNDNAGVVHLVFMSAGNASPRSLLPAAPAEEEDLSPLSSDLAIIDVKPVALPQPVALPFDPDNPDPQNLGWWVNPNAAPEPALDAEEEDDGTDEETALLEGNTSAPALLAVRLKSRGGARKPKAESELAP